MLVKFHFERKPQEGTNAGLYFELPCEFAADNLGTTDQFNWRTIPTIDWLFVCLFVPGVCTVCPQTESVPRQFI